MRNVIPMNLDWKFQKTEQIPGVLPEGWESVNLPHTWNAKDGQDGGNDYWRGTAMYCKKIVRPALGPGDRAYLEVNGGANITDVYVNGEKLGHHEGGYSTFRVDITPALKEENLLCISVDNRENDYVYPQKADFTFYGGLYRQVNLIVVSQAHFELERDGTSGIWITPEVDLETGCANVKVETWQRGGDKVVVTINEVSACQNTTEEHTFVYLKLDSVHLWNGLDDPFLYTATARLYCGGEVVDEISVRFGCRTIGFDPGVGFLLNGKPYPLRGVSRHQDWADLGNALTMREHKRDMELIREIGANTIRLAHYQHAQEFYDLCDENGMVVWAEIPYITEHMPNGRENTLSQMRELITQCYNHPSIVCWGLSNEIAVHGVSEDLMENHVLLNNLCHRMDSTRPTTMAHAFMLEQESPLIQVADLGSYNLYFGWYMGNLDQNDLFFEEYHQKFPNRMMGFSEYGADCNVQFQSAVPEQGDYSEQYQCKYHEHILNCIEHHSWMWATHAWNMFDFAADGRDEGGAHGLNQKGLITIDRKIKKDAFYLYKAAWNKAEPFVHICGRRFIDRVGPETEIKVYSNLSHVALLVDGHQIGSQEGKTVFLFRVPLSGEHTVTAISGACRDSITIRKVAEPNASYRFGKAGAVANWFDEANFDSSCWSIRDSFGALMADPEASKIVEALMERIIASRGDVAKTANKNPNLQKMLAGMSFQSLLKQAGDTIPPETSKEVNAQLQKIRK